MGWLSLPLPLGQSSMSWTWQMTHKAGIHMELVPERGEKKNLSLTSALESFLEL